MQYICSNDGIQIAVEDINPEAKKVVVLVHGWPISKEMYEYQKDVLNNCGYRIVSYDIRGFGDSQVSGKRYCYNQLATDLYTILNVLELENITLVGFSMGGAICTHYMSMYHNQHVSKLVLAGAAVPSYTITPHNPYGSTIDTTNKLINSLYQDRPKAVSDFGQKVFALAHSQEFQSWFRGLCFKASGIGTIQTAISLRDEDVYKDMYDIHVPTLIMHGTLDQICPYGFAKIMHQAITNSYLYEFKYSGHGLFYDEREKFNQLLIDFIES